METGEASMAIETTKVMEVEEKLTDITQCSICTETFKEPKILPCIHTFCLTCLREFGMKTKKGEGDQMPCPLCRKQFTIPEIGFSGLQRNFFMERLIEIQKILQPSQTPIACDACLEDQETETETPKAEMYCVECRQKLCQDCCKHHRKSKMTKNHKMVSLEGQMESMGADMLETFLPVMCDEHSSKPLEIFCSSCQETLCALCFIESHKSHDWCDINQKVDEFRNEIKKNIEFLSSLRSDLEEKRHDLERYNIETYQKMDTMHGEINRRREDLKELIDIQADKILQELEVLRRVKLKKDEIKNEEIETLLVSIDSFLAYCTQIRDNGSSSDICKAVNDLNARAEDLKAIYDTIIQSLKETQSTTQSALNLTTLRNFWRRNAENVIGKPSEHEFPGHGNKDIKPSNITLFKEMMEAFEDRSNPEEQNDIYSASQSIEFCEKLKKSEEIITEMNEKLETLIEELKREKDSREEVLKMSQSLSDQNKELLSNEQKLNIKIKDLKKQVDLLEALTYGGTNATKTVGEFGYAVAPKLWCTIAPLTLDDFDSVKVSGFAILNNELFIANDSKTVEVRDLESLEFKQRWKLDRLSTVKDMRHCVTNRCLYFMNQAPTNEKNEILRVDPYGVLINSWSVDDAWGNLSITDDSNVLLAASNKNQLQEYAPDGKLVRVIQLTWNYGFLNPSHAIKLTSGHYMVSHRQDSYELRRICIIDTEGKVLRSFRKERSGEVLDYPIYMAVDRNGNILMIDNSKNQLLVLSSNFKELCKVTGVLNPLKLLLDETNGRIFIAASGNDAPSLSLNRPPSSSGFFTFYDYDLKSSRLPPRSFPVGVCKNDLQNSRQSVSVYSLSKK